MNRLFWLALSFISLQSFAQLPNLPMDEEGHINYTEVVKVDSSLSQQQLYLRAKEWFAKTYRSAQAVIQMDDKETGKIVGKALFPVTHQVMGAPTSSGNINYSITIQAKDGRYKYEITSFYHTRELSKPGSLDFGSCDAMMQEKRKSWQKMYSNYLNQLDVRTKSLVEDLKASMSSTSTSKKKDDW